MEGHRATTEIKAHLARITDMSTLESHDVGEMSLLATFVQSIEEILTETGYVLPVAVVIPRDGKSTTIFGHPRFDVPAQEEFKAKVTKACADARILFVAVELQATRDVGGVIPVVEVTAYRKLMIRVDHVDSGSHIFAADIKDDGKKIELGPWLDAPMFSDKFAGLLPSATRG